MPHESATVRLRALAQIAGHGVFPKVVVRDRRNQALHEAPEAEVFVRPL